MRDKTAYMRRYRERRRRAGFRDVSLSRVDYDLLEAIRAHIRELGETTRESLTQQVVSWLEDAR